MKCTDLLKTLILILVIFTTQNINSQTTEVISFNPEIGEYGDMKVTFPDGWAEGDNRPVIILAHGGAWVGGTYDAFYSLGWCQYFAEHGMVGISINYRLDSIAHAAMDCRTAARYVKGHAYELGIDSSKVVAGGQSAGGQLSYCMYSADGVDYATDDLSISPKPDLFIFLDGALALNGGRMDQVAAVVGEELAQGCQPGSNVRADYPPTLYLYGEDDGYRGSGAGCYDKALVFGIRQSMWLAPGGGHGIGFQSTEWNNNCLYLAHNFLVEYGYLTGSPTVSLPTTDPVMYEFTFGGTREVLITPDTVLCVPSVAGSQVAENMINNTGFTDNPVEQSSYYDYSTTSTWRSLGDQNIGKVIFDFGENVDFDQMHLWNYNDENNWYYVGIDEVALSVSSGTDTAASNFTLLDTINLFAALHHCQNYNFTGTDVRLLKFDIVSNFASGFTGFGKLKVSHADDQDGTIKPRYVVLDNTNIALGPDGTIQLTETVYPTNAANKNVTWSSSDPSLATVSSTGLVTAISNGYAVITVTAEAGDFVANCKVNVIDPVAATGVTINKSELEIAATLTSKLSATVSPTDATNKIITWSTDASGIATVDETGLVTAVTEGIANIIVTTTDGGFKDTCVVTVTAPVSVTEVSLSIDSISIYHGTTYQLAAIVAPADATLKTVTWSTAADSIATVDENGLVTADLGGTTYITVTTDDGGFTADCKVVVIGDTTIAVETFSNLNSSTSDYTSGNYIGDNGETWYYERTMLIESGISGYSPELRANNGLIYTVLEDGIDKLTFTFLNQDGYTSASYTRINITINDSLFGTYSLNTIDVAKTVTIEDINFHGPDTLRITPGGWYTKIDDIIWTTPAPVVLVTGVSLDKTSVSFYENEIVNLMATIEPADATNRNLIWTSDDESVVIVDENGAIESVNPGTATVTVTTEDGSFTATCDVTVVVPVLNVALDETSLMLETAATSQLTATVWPDNATNTNITWETTAPGVATVSSSGLVTAIAAGNAKIVVKTEDGNKTDTCYVIVADEIISVTSVSLDQSTASIPDNGSVQLTETVLPLDATNKNVTWSSLNESSATVDANGLVTAIAAGTTTITVTTVDGSFTATCNITVTSTTVPVTGVSLDPTNVNLTVSETSQLTETVLPANATNKNINWTSDDDGIASVSASGLITAVSAGSTTITATTVDGSFTATCNVTVTAATISVTGIDLDSTSLDLEIDDTWQLNETISPANASNTNVTWTSSDEGIATVNNGLVTAIALGTATISVTSVDGSFTATCTVNITEEVIIGISDNKIDINIYPIPASNYINIVSSTSNVSIDIYNVSGKKVYSSVIKTRSSIDVSDWSKGIYLVNISSKTINETRSIIIK